MNKTLPVSAIQYGTVIDHIKPGNALRIMHLLGLVKSGFQMTLGLNLPSKRIGSKDLIKIENRILTPEEANEVVVFSPSATINVIENYNVIEKIKTHFPASMSLCYSAVPAWLSRAAMKLLACANPQASSCSTEASTCYWLPQSDR